MNDNVMEMEEAMNENDLREYVDERGGMIAAPELSEVLEVDVRETRAWATENDLPTIGQAYVFTTEDALAFAEDLEDEESEEAEDLDDEDTEEDGAEEAAEDAG